MKDAKICKDHPLPLPSDQNFVRKLISPIGDSDNKAQANLAKTMRCDYRNLVGKLIYAMVTCRPDISFATVKCAQSSACPAEIYFKGVKHYMRYLYATHKDDIIF